MKTRNLTTLMGVTALTFVVGCSACKIALLAAGPSCRPSGDQTVLRTVPYDKVAVIEKTGPREVPPGEEFTYTITATNKGRESLANAVVTEELPENLAFTRADPEATVDGCILTWRIGSLAPGESRTFRVSAEPADVGKFQTCTVLTYDPPPVCLNVAAVRPMLAVALYGPEENILCDPLTYRVVVRNDGDRPICGVLVRDDLPDGVKLLDGETVWTERIANLPAGESREFTFRARAAEKGVYMHRAFATAQGVSAESEELATVVNQPVLIITKETPPVTHVDRPITYTIIVSNAGDAPARNTILTEELAPNTELVSASDGGRLGSPLVRWDLGTLAPGETKEVTLTIKGSKEGDVCTLASAKAFCGEGEALSGLKVEGVPAILLESVDLNDPIEVGSDTTYEVRVVNQGSTDGTNIAVTVELPAELSFISSDGPSKAEVSGRTLRFAPVPNLPAGDKAVWKIHARGDQPGDVRFKVTLKTDQMNTPVMETESTNIFQ